MRLQAKVALLRPEELNGKLPVRSRLQIEQYDE
jgi:hypothetical protein